MGPLYSTGSRADSKSSATSVRACRTTASTAFKATSSSKVDSIGNTVRGVPPSLVPFDAVN
jgi:hypothetical protein